MKGVLITGGSRGIGRAMVEAFSAAGWRVAFTYLKSDQAARELEARLGAVAIRADQSSEEQILSAVKTAQSALGSIDALINNAAVSSFSLFTELTLCATVITVESGSEVERAALRLASVL